MSSNYSSDRGRSRNGGGGRRRSSGSQNRGHGDHRSAERVRTHESARTTVQKKGFFAKLLSVIGIGGKKKPASGKPQRSAREDRPEGASASPRQSRKPERIEVTTPRVYVGNLSFDATESDLLELFSGVGSVQNVEIVSNRETHRSKGFGFVQLATVDEAKRAVDELHDKEYMGRKMVVSGAKAAPAQRSERSERRSSESQGDSEAAAA